MIDRLKTVILFSFVSMASASAAVLTPAFPMIQAEWQLPNAHLQWVVSVFLLGYLLGQWIYGPIASRWGRISALKLGFSLNLLGILISFFSVHFGLYPGFLLGRFITALGASAGLVCTFILLNEYFDPERAKGLFPYVTLSFTLGIGAATWIGGNIAAHFGWQWNFLALFIQGVFARWVLQYFPETLSQPRSIRPLAIAASYAGAFCSKRLMTYAIWVGWVSAFSYGYAMMAPILTKHWFHLDSALYGNYALINMAGMFLGSFAAVPVIKRYQDKSIILSSSVLMLTLIFGVFFLQKMNFLNAVGFFFMSGGCYFLLSFLFPAASHAASTSMPDKAQAAGAMSGINLGLAMMMLILMGILPWGFFINFLGVISVLSVLGFFLILIRSGKSKA